MTLAPLTKVSFMVGTTKHTGVVLLYLDAGNVLVNDSSPLTTQRLLKEAALTVVTPAPAPTPVPAPGVSPIPPPPTGLSVVSGATLSNVTESNVEYRGCKGGWVSIRPGVRSVVFRDLDCAAVSVDGGKDVWFINPDVGAIQDVHPAIAGNSSTERPENIYFDGGLFHDITVSASGIHNEGLQVIRVRNLVMYRTVFKNNMIFNVFLSCRGPGTDSIDGVLLQELELNRIDSAHTYVLRVDDGASNQGGALPRNVTMLNCKIPVDGQVSFNQSLEATGCKQIGTQRVL